MHKRIGVIILISVAVLVMIVTYAVAVRANKPKVTPVDPYADLVTLYGAEMASDSVSAVEKQNLARKLGPLLEEGTQRAEAVTRRAQGTLPMTKITVSPIEVHQLPDGIDEQPAIPMFTSQLVLTNAWRKTVGETTYLVYAGALKDDPQQGVALMQVPGTVGFVRYLAPGKTGMLKITGVENFTLILTGETGATMYFDVLGMRFVDSLDAVAEPANAPLTLTPAP